ncbi:hypothetical protein CHISP_1841 [Chitinispirillum alkaliphilum]|nr:hypothetical protein CHISP_1841 [Chitinispirillum alkaliphilum]
MEYQKEWKALFETEKASIIRAITDDSAWVEHIGSTSVPELAAKPIIDIMIGLKGFATADDFVLSLQDIGYRYISEFETSFPERKFLVKAQDGVSTHHIHMVEYGSHFWRRHILFRDYLINNQMAKEQYESLKRDLALKEWEDGNEYASAKTSFIREIERKADS